MSRGLAIGVLTIGILAAGMQGRPYAAKPRIPDEPTTDPVLQMEIASVRSATIPPRSDIDIPPYPHALVIRATEARFRSIEGRKTVTRYPVIVLVTPESLPEVVSFYERHLTDWSHARLLDAHFFWAGTEGEFDPLSEEALTTASVQVRTARPIRLVPEARTEIHVRYRPPRQFIEFHPGLEDGSEP